MESFNWTGDIAPDFDQDLANTYIEKYILVGVTYLDHSGDFIEQLQMHGVIRSASPKGIQIELKGEKDGQSWNMPPSLESISFAQPGIYTLRETSEEVENPDLLATWTVTKPA